MFRYSFPHNTTNSETQVHKLEQATISITDLEPTMPPLHNIRLLMNSNAAWFELREDRFLSFTIPNRDAQFKTEARFSNCLQLEECHLIL